MAPKRASKQQQQLNVDQFKLLKKPMDHLGKQINVPGSFWEGRMLQDERDKVYKCTIVDFSLAHKFAPDSSPRKAFKMQEMGIDGTGIIGTDIIRKSVTSSHHPAIFRCRGRGTS